MQTCKVVTTKEEKISSGKYGQAMKVLKRDKAYFSIKGCLYGPLPTN